MIHVENFAKDTGDWKSLSKVDLQVIALGVRLAKEKGEIDNIKKEPQPLTEFRPDNFNSVYEKKYDEQDYDSETDEEADGAEGKPAAADKKPAANDDDDWNDVAEDRQDKRTRVRNEAKKEHWEKKQAEKRAKFPEAKVQLEKKKEEDDGESSGLDDEDEGGEWITQDNLHKYMDKGDVELPEPLQQDLDKNNDAPKDGESNGQSEERKENPVPAKRKYFQMKEGGRTSSLRALNIL